MKYWLDCSLFFFNDSKFETRWEKAREFRIIVNIEYLQALQVILKYFLFVSQESSSKFDYDHDDRLTIDILIEDDLTSLRGTFETASNCKIQLEWISNDLDAFYRSAHNFPASSPPPLRSSLLDPRMLAHTRMCARVWKVIQKSRCKNSSLHTLRRHSELCRKVA